VCTVEIRCGEICVSSRLRGCVQVSHGGTVGPWIGATGRGKHGWDASPPGSGQVTSRDPDCSRKYPGCHVTGTPFRSGDLGIGSSCSGTSGIRLDWRLDYAEVPPSTRAASGGLLFYTHVIWKLWKEVDP